MMCDRGAESQMNQLWDEELRLGTAVAFDAYGRTLEMVKLFKYLSRIIRA